MMSKRFILTQFPIFLTTKTFPPKNKNPVQNRVNTSVSHVVPRKTHPSRKACHNAPPNLEGPPERSTSTAFYVHEKWLRGATRSWPAQLVPGWGVAARFSSCTHIRLAACTKSEINRVTESEVCKAFACSSRWPNAAGKELKVALVGFVGKVVNFAENYWRFLCGTWSVFFWEVTEQKNGLRKQNLQEISWLDCILPDLTVDGHLLTLPTKQKLLSV